MHLTNYHSHCSFCDGKGKMEEFIESAVRAGFTAYGISSHAPQPFGYSCNMLYEDMTTYLSEFNGLKTKYEEQIELYIGLEIDYLDSINNPANPYFRNLPLDYRIGSIHMIETGKNEYTDIDTGREQFAKTLKEKFGNDIKKLVNLYFDASMRMVETGGFDFIGHCDKVHRHAENTESGITRSVWYQEKLKAFFSLIAEKELAVEINTKAFTPKGCFFPDKSSFRLLKELDIPVLVNSDAHYPELINAGREEALQLLRECGFKSIRQLLNQKWTDVAIS